MNTNQEIHIYLHGKIAGKIIPKDVVLTEAEINYTKLHFKNGNFTKFHTAKKVFSSCESVKALRNFVTPKFVGVPELINHPKSFWWV